MTSGEVLFILTFIVLPTAVLVSSAWAVVFVRRRPDRVVRQQEERTFLEGPETTASDEDTVVIAAVSRPQPIPESDVADIDGETPVEVVEETAETLDRDEERVSDDAALVDAVAVIGPEVPPSIDASDDPSAPDRLESTVVQTTDDLEEVVEQVAAAESLEAEEEADTEANEGAAVDEDDPYDDEQEEIGETTELPVIEPAAREDTTRDQSPDEAEQEPGSGPRWRRKRSVKLRQAETDAPRARGRNRDPQRQVPQLGRSSRRTDVSPPDSGTDGDEPQPEQR